MDNAERLLRVIRAMNESGPVSVLELNRTTRISRPAIYRLMEILVRNGYVRRIPDQSKFELTSEIKLLSAGFRDRDWIAEVGGPVIANLQGNILWPTSLAAFNQGSMVIRETTRYTSPFVFDTGSVGMKLPVLTTALGLAYISFVSEKSRGIIFDLLKKSNDPWDAVARNTEETNRLLRETKQRGYGLRQGGIEPRTSTIAVPVIMNGEAAASICVTFGRNALPLKNAVENFLPLLTDASVEIATQASSHAKG
jgi:IclR family transcriptional regulator, mhp operon transcriptional activator